MKCAQCNEPAMMRCKSHRQTLCGDPYCVDLHRWGGGSCDFFPIPKNYRSLEPMDWVVAIGAVITLVVGVAVVVVHI